MKTTILTSILKSCESGNVKCLKKYLSNEDVISLSDDEKIAIKMAGILSDNDEIVDYLNKIGIINVHENKEIDFLVSCEIARLNVVKWFIEHGATRIPEAFGISCLNEHKNLIKYFIHSGKIDNDEIIFALLVAVKCGKINSVDCIVTETEIDSDEIKEKIMITATENNRLDIIVYMIEHYNINSNIIKKTMENAVYHEHVDIIKYLRSKMKQEGMR